MTTTVHEVSTLRVSPTELFARLSDARVIEERAGADPAMPSQVLGHAVEGDVITIRTGAALPLDWVPAAVRDRIAQDASPAVERTERWRRMADGLESTTEFTITGVGGVDAQAEGRSRVTAEDQGSRLEEHVSITVRVPLLGGVIEKALAPRIAVTMKREVEVLDA